MMRYSTYHWHTIAYLHSIQGTCNQTISKNLKNRWRMIAECCELRRNFEISPWVGQAARSCAYRISQAGLRDDVPLGILAPNCLGWLYYCYTRTQELLMCQEFSFGCKCCLYWRIPQQSHGWSKILKPCKWEYLSNFFLYLFCPRCAGFQQIVGALTSVRWIFNRVDTQIWHLVIAILFATMMVVIFCPIWFFTVFCSCLLPWPFSIFFHVLGPSHRNL